MPPKPMDFRYLEEFAAGDMQVVAEVLELFQDQAAGWRPRLERPAEGWRELIHNMKGSARGIGATALGDICEIAEFGDPALAPKVRAHLDDVLADIEGYLSRVGGG